MFDEINGRRLDGLRILVAENDYIQCDGIVSCLAAMGATVVGPAHSLPEARQLLASNSIHFAIIDINLGDGVSFDLADALQSRSLPFIFATGYDCRNIPPELRHIKCLPKPFTEHALVSLLVDTVGETRH